MDLMRPTDNLLMRHATTIAITAITLVMTLAAIIFWRQESADEAAKGWVNHTYEVIGHIDLLLDSLKDAELGKRGYLLTGDESFLEPYENALRDGTTTGADRLSRQRHHSIAQELAIIKELTADNPAQQNNIEELEATVAKLMDFMSKTIQAKQALKDKDAVPKVNFLYGKGLMDNIRSTVRIMEAEENHLLALRLEADAINDRENEQIVFTGIGLFYAIIVFCVWLYQRTRARAVLQMLHYTQELERSEEELKMQQEELKTSNEEIEAANEEMEEKTKALEEQNAQIQQQSEELEESKRLIEEKANELERASKYKSEFLANMSHELRTPLNSLLILAKMLAANESGNLTNEQIEEATVIYNGGLELLGLINDILDLSKVEAGKLTITAEEMTIDGIVQHMRQQFAPVAKEKGIEFPIHVAKDVPASLYTDGQRVEQILKNLLSNAFKFTERGAVTLEVRRADPNEVHRAYGAIEMAAFSVIDTGIGIEATKFKDIFEAFQQEDGSTDRHYGGTGLGLTIARKFAHMLGGEIQVASTKGEGSRFTLLLPLAMVETETAGTNTLQESTYIAPKPAPKIVMNEFIADDRNHIADKDKVLLVIEDDASFAEVLVKMARKRGYKCLAAGDGRTGLVLASEQPVTAVILDLKLPDMDGMQVLDQLKHSLRTRHIPVHIISGREEGNVVPLRKGAIGYLTKPVEREAIDGVFTKIEELLQSEVKRVLVVEDDAKTQVAIQSLLRKKEIAITIVSTGSAALRHLREIHFDCVILDLHLPDMSGLDWLKKVEHEGGARHIPPVIVYTAQELNEEENRQLSHLTSSIIIKGAKSPERLLDEVTLFLHSVESTLSADQQEIIRMQHDPDKVLQGRTLLLVDDDLRNTFALSKLLKKRGMQIIIADNGQMALEKLEADPSIELVIMDIMMPVMDGYQAMREIRARKAFKNIPIIALTARAMPEEQEKCMEAGANDYLTKPVDIERLLTLLRVWLFRQEAAA
jgi:CheY-like chemotaxis protein/signal transduction histidine kinase